MAQSIDIPREQKLYFALIEVDTKSHHPVVIGIYKNREAAYKDRDMLMKGNRSDPLYVRVGVMINTEEEGADGLV